MMKPRNNSDNSKKVFNLLSLFSGGGLLDIGFMNQGFQVVQAVEIDPVFIRAYNAAIGNYVETTKDNPFITSGLIKHEPIKAAIDASNKLEQLELARRHKGVWGLAGGPPCQDYSVGGNNAGIEGERGKLIKSYLKIVELIEPNFLFFENVEGLYKTKSHQAAFKNFVSKIERLGYFVWYDILNVLYYGYAQDRPRIVLVAFKKNIIETLIRAGYILEKDNNKLKTGSPQNIFNWPTQQIQGIKDVNWPGKWPFNSCDVKEVKIPAEYKGMQVINAFEGINDSTPNQNDCFKPKSSKFATIQEGDTNRKSFKRLHRYRYSPTVAYGNNEVHLHPTEPRRLTVREALRLQTAPDNYILPDDVSLTHKYKLISNGVPVAKAELVAREIRRTLLNYLKAVEDGHLVK